MNTGTKIAISAIGGFLVAVMLFGAGHAIVALHGFGGYDRGRMVSDRYADCPIQGQNDDGFRGGREYGGRMGRQSDGRTPFGGGCQNCPSGDYSGEWSPRGGYAPGETR